MFSKTSWSCLVTIFENNFLFFRAKKKMFDNQKTENKLF